MLNAKAIVLWWAGIATFLGAYFWKNPPRLTTQTVLAALARLRSFASDEKAYVFFIVTVLILTATIAWVAPPNTFDSMTYHMSRVMHWRQNSTVDFYPTTILRQLLSAPWAEYAILQTVLLSGGDRFANFVQWSSMLGSIAVVAGIANELGASRKGQIFAAIFSITLPMGILQSTSTQNDYIVGFWMLCFVFQLLRFYKTKQLIDAVALSLALGLAILTKPTAYIYAAPFVCWFVLQGLYRAGLKRRAQLLACLSLAVLVNAGHFYRNHEFSGALLGQTLETGDYSYENATFGVRVTASNVLRNIGLHLESGSRFDRGLQRAIEKGHDWIGIAIDDKRTSWPEYEFRVQGLKHHEDYAGNLWHTLLIIFGMAIYFLFFSKRTQTTVYTIALVSAFLLFCTLLRWQPWHSRLQLPLFLLWAPFVGLILGRIQDIRIKDVLHIQTPLLSEKLPKVKAFLASVQTIKLSVIVGVLLLLSSLPSIFLSETKPILGQQSIFSVDRSKQFFYGAPPLSDPILAIAKSISETKCTQVGLLGFGNDWEYPFWSLIHPSEAQKVEIRHVSASHTGPKGTPLSASGMNKNFVACAIVTPGHVDHDVLELMGRRYKQTFSSQALKLFQ